MRVISLLVLSLLALAKPCFGQVGAELLLPRPGDSIQYSYIGLDCLDDHNCAVAGQGYNKAEKRYTLFVERTTDGGITWVKHPLPYGKQGSFIDKRVRRLEMVDSLSIYVCGDGGLIAFSSDGGKSWDDQSVDDTRLISSSSFISQGVGSICGGSGLLYNTTNGGAFWHRVERLPKAWFSHIRQFSETNCSALAHGFGPIYSTNNSWATVDSTPTFVWGISDSEYRIVNSLHWWSEEAVCAVGTVLPRSGDLPTRPFFIKSSNGGLSWQNVFDRATQLRTGVLTFQAGGVGLIGGAGGAILVTMDSGKSWSEDTLLNRVAAPEVMEVKLLDSHRAIAVRRLALNVEDVVLLSFNKSRVARYEDQLRFGTRIHPNPAQKTIHVRNPTAYSGLITINDILGREVIRRSVTGALDCELGIEPFPSGVYVVRIEHNGRWLSVGRFVKQ